MLTSLSISSPDLLADSASMLAFETSALFVALMNTAVKGTMPKVSTVAVPYKAEMLRAAGSVTNFPERMDHAR